MSHIFCRLLQTFRTVKKSYKTQLQKFGKEVKRLRAEHAVTQQELAAKCDIDVRTIQRVEAGEHSVGLHILFSLADAFQMHPYELLKNK